MPDFLLLEVPVTGVGAPPTSARSCVPSPSVRVGAALSRPGYSGGWGRGRGRSKREAHLPTEPERGEVPCPPSPCQKYCHFSRKEPSPAQQVTRRRWTGCGHREAYGKKGILRKYIGPARFEYCSFPLCSFTDQTFCLSLQFSGGEGADNPPIFFQGYFKRNIKGRH